MRRAQSLRRLAKLVARPPPRASARRAVVLPAGWSRRISADRAGVHERQVFPRPAVGDGCSRPQRLDQDCSRRAPFSSGWDRAGIKFINRNGAWEGLHSIQLASFCRETPRLNGGYPSYLDGLGTNWQYRPASASPGRVISGLGSVLLGKLSARDTLKRGRSDLPEAGLRVGQAALRLRGDRVVSSAAILMRLLASTAAPTHNSKRSRPSARQRFMPRPRNSTEMRPSMPARKR